MDTASVSVDYLPKELVNISKKIKNKERVSDDEALFLLENASLALLFGFVVVR